MTEALTTNLFGKPVGAIQLGVEGYCSFEYNREFRQSGMQPSPLLMPAIQLRIYRCPLLSRNTFCGLLGKRPGGIVPRQA